MVDDMLKNAYRWHRQHGTYNGTRGAITRAREDVAKGTKRFPHSPDHAKLTRGSWQERENMAKFSSPSDRAYFCDNWPKGLRMVGRTDEVAKHEYNNGRSASRDLRDCQGWYTEDDGGNGETISGYVLQLPARDHKPRYIAGTASTAWEGVTLYPLDMHDDPIDAAHAANRIAEKDAEEERDYNRAWHAGQHAWLLEQEVLKLRTRIIQVCSDLRTARRAMTAQAGDTAKTAADSIARLCSIARDRVGSMLYEIEKLREERDELRNNYGREDAFKEGYNG